MSNTFGQIDKDFIEEGPFRATFFDIQVDDPKILSDVSLWMVDPDNDDTFFLTTGEQTTLSSGEVVYEFFGNTQRAQKLISDGTLETTKETGTLKNDETSGSTSIVVENLSVLSISAGEKITVGGDSQEYEVQSDASVSNGEATLDIDPDLQKDYSAGAEVKLLNQDAGAKLRELETDKIYLAEVSYELDALTLKAVGARKEVLVRESYSITSN